MGFIDWIIGGHYEVTMICTNCDRVVRVQIRKGQSVERWALNRKCKRCKIRNRFQKYS